MNEPIINSIDVSEYFIEVVDGGGSTIDYKLLPNSERLLVEKIFEQNQQLARLQEENEELKEKIHFKNLYKLSGKCFFDAARQCNYFDDFVKARQALENIRTYINQECKNKQCPQTCANCFMGNVLIKVNEVLKQ